MTFTEAKKLTLLLAYPIWDVPGAELLVFYTRTPSYLAALTRV